MTDNLRILKVQLIASVQPADIVILNDSFFALLNVPALTIMAHLTELHGTLNSSDFAYLRSQLSLPMAPSASLRNASVYPRPVRRSSASLSELDKWHYFREAITTFTHINHAIDSFPCGRTKLQRPHHPHTTASTQFHSISSSNGVRSNYKRSTTLHISTLTTYPHSCTYQHFPPSSQPSSKRLLRLILAANAHVLHSLPHIVHTYVHTQSTSLVVFRTSF